MDRESHSRQSTVAKLSQNEFGARTWKTGRDMQTSETQHMGWPHNECGTFLWTTVHTPLWRKPFFPRVLPSTPSGVGKNQPSGEKVGRNARSVREWMPTPACGRVARRNNHAHWLSAHMTNCLRLCTEQLCSTHGERRVSSNVMPLGSNRYRLEPFYIFHVQRADSLYESRHFALCNTFVTSFEPDCS